MQLYNNYKLLLPILFVAIVLSTSLYTIAFCLIVLLLFPLIKIYKEKFIVFSLISGYFLFTSDFNEQFRNIYNFAGIAIFLFLFLKHFGLTYKSYPKLPKNINTLIVIVLVSLGVSTIFSVDISISIFRVSKQLLFFFFVILFIP